MKHLLNILLGALLLLAAGCQDELPESAKIETGKENLTFTQGSGTRTVKITSNQAWTATSSGAWLTVSPDKGGAGTHELTLTAKANTTSSSRVAEVAVQVGHKVSTIRATQAQQDAMGLDRDSETVPWPAGSIELTLSANINDYQIESDADWLQATQTKAMEEHTLELVYEENESYDPRSATVTVSNGSLSSTFTLTQGGRGALYFVIATDTVAYDATQFELVLMKNTSSNGLTLIDNAPWLTLPQDTKAMPQEERIVLNLQPNTETTPREARLVINDESTGTLLTDTFTLVQRGLENVLQPATPQQEVPAEGMTFDLPVVASGPFEVILPEDAEWLTGSTGVQLPGTLQFTAAANPTTLVRTAVITLRLQNTQPTDPADPTDPVNPVEATAPVEATVTVTQAAAEKPETDRIPRLYNLLELATVIETDPVNLGAFRATVAYDAGEPTDWVNDIYAYGGKLHFRLDGNPTADKRSATLRLALETGDIIEVRINQSGTGQAYVELDKPGSLASYIDYANKEHYKSIRVKSDSGINADDFNTLRSAILGITDIDLSGVKQLTTLPDAIFKDARSLRSLTLPEGLTDIGNEAFEGCTALVTQLFPASLLTIGDRAFAGAFTGSDEARALDLSTATALRTIGKEAFDGCNTLVELTLPDNLLEIGEGAFRECYNLTGSLTLPTRLSTIGAEAFYNCKNLTGTLAFPAALKQLGERAFMKCAKLEALDLSASHLSTIAAETFKESLTGASEDKLVVVVPQGVTTIAASAFEDTGLAEVDLPATLTEIGRRAFYNCRNLSVVNCRRTGTVPLLDTTYPGETFGGIGIGGERILKVGATSVELYTNDPQWTLATPATGRVVWKIETL